MEPLHQHVFVCTQGKPEGIASCHNHGSLRVLQALERELDCQGLDEQIQVTTCGCLGLCGNGPVMITYPEGIWYRGVKEEDVPEIVDSHLRSGNVVSRLVWSNGPAMKTEISDSREHYRAMVRAKDQAGTLPDTLNEMIRSFMPSRAVLTALELDVFTAVASGASAEQVAQKIQADPRATEMLLNVLVSLRLLDKKEGRFFNTVAAARFFCEGSRDNSRGGLMHTTQLWHRWSSLTECVRAGTSVETSSREDSPVSDFIAAMDRNARERADAVVKATGIDGIKRMLDLGGGSGAYSIAFARAVPSSPWCKC
jgi:(2Fe-2S) ferredoxin